MTSSGLICYPGNRQQMNSVKAAGSFIGSSGLRYICMEKLAFDLVPLTEVTKHNSHICP